MNNKWNRKNALWMLLYAVLYAAVTAVVCVTGSIHPIFFVCYQITAGLLLPIVIRAFRSVQAPGAAVCLFLGILLLLLIIRDAVMWHVVPLIVITALAEAVRGVTSYSRFGDIAGTVLMTFSSLMSVSPVWAFPAVVIIGVIVSVWIANVSMKKHKDIEKAEYAGFD